MQRKLMTSTSSSAYVGRIGRIFTLSKDLVQAGDSIDLSISGLLRQSNLRRGLNYNAEFSMHSFYVPHRYLFDNWEEFLLEAGQASSISDSTGRGTQKLAGHVFDTQKLGCLATPRTGFLPNWATVPYLAIYNRYFRYPAEGVQPEYDEIPSVIDNFDDVTKKYGLPACHLPTEYTSGISPDGWDSSDYDFPSGAFTPDTISYDATSSTSDIRAVDLVKSRYKTELLKKWGGIRYVEYMRNKFGTSLPMEVEKKPTLLFSKTFNLTGYQVDGTSEESLGSFTGNAQLDFNYSMPRKFFAEHGTLWTLGVLRYVPISYNEAHPLEGSEGQYYDRIVADPSIVNNTPPQLVSSNSFFSDGGTNPKVVKPNSWFYGWTPNFIHEDYRDVKGFPFLENMGARLNNLSLSTTMLVNDRDYDAVFSTQQLQHFNIQAARVKNTLSPIASAMESAYAGS